MPVWLTSQAREGIKGGKVSFKKMKVMPKLEQKRALHVATQTKVSAKLVFKNILLIAKDQVIKHQQFFQAMSRKQPGKQLNP